MAGSSDFPPAFVLPWKELLLSHQAQQLKDFPDYYARDPESLITTSSPQTLYVGTGHTIFVRGILPAILDAKSSVHFVTCYWAASPSLDAIKDALTQLATSRRAGGVTSPKLRITIGFSSWGLFQKLFHSSSKDGEIYPPSKWAKHGLPDERTLASGGIQLAVKSLFFTPISVMHPKYVLIDGKRAFVPSCNVSWEKWFEGCVELEGDIVKTLVAFHDRVWGAGSADALEPTDINDSTSHTEVARENGFPIADGANSESGFLPDDETSATQSLKVGSDKPVPTILLPSPHHRNPRFSFFTFFSQSDPPMTPLNVALLTLFTNARREITILTPNVTSWPVLNALLDALLRGVNVQIRTNKGMMLIEQLVTAGTTTSLCMKQFVKKYQALREKNNQAHDIEAQPVFPGSLEVLYYKSSTQRSGLEDEPVVSHFKMTMVDGEYLVLGSGNMDRASWWTSQELGVLFYTPGTNWQKLWDGVLDKRMDVFYQSPRDS